MKKLTSILLGWWFWITNRNNELAKTRLKVCASCMFREGMICGICSCVLQAKARLPEESCPAHRWPGDNKYNFIDGGHIKSTG